MKIKDLIEVDTVNYKEISMFIATCYCDWKCCHEQGISESICQNNLIAKQKNIDISVDEIFHRYIANSLTSAVVLGGLEVLLQWDEVIELVKYFRDHGCDSVFSIYSGYYKNEIEKQINQIRKYKNITFKFGRFIPNQEKHYDDVLGVYLASDNQYGKVIS